MVFEVIGLFGLILAIIFIVIALLLLIFLVGTLIHFLPAVIVAILVWLLTGSFFWGAIAFLVVALLMVLWRR